MTLNDHDVTPPDPHDVKKPPKSEYKKPANPEWMITFPTLGWRSVDEQGKLPPGQREFVPLPPGVKPAISPQDKERMVQQGRVITGPVEFPTSFGLVARANEALCTWKFTRLDEWPRYMRETYNKLSLFDTEPRYHVPLSFMTDIWDCEVADAWCTRMADRRAMVERKIDWHIMRTLFKRLHDCKQASTYGELQDLSINFSYEYFCGDLDETLRETEAAYELKWGKIFDRHSSWKMARLAYFKQKNRYIEDRFRHRMMANVDAKVNMDNLSYNTWKTIDGPDQRMINSRTDKGPGHKDYWDMFDSYENKRNWDIDTALLKEAEKRRKARKNLSEQSE